MRVALGWEVIMEQRPPEPRLEYLARFSVDLGPPWEVGVTSGLGDRRIFPIIGGSFDGPLLRGAILDNGADWQVVTPEGVSLIDTRYLLRLDDGALAYLQTRGFRHGPPEVLAAVAAGDPVDPHQYFFRVYMTFETASGTYGWLNRAMAIGSAMRRANAVIYDAYLIQ
jgi:Protein of unknown function (DUF3237)